MEWLIFLIFYVICGYCVGQLLGFNGVIDILLFPIVAIIKLFFTDKEE